MKALDEFVRTVTVEGATLIEERIKVLLQDKPRWLPERIWRRFLGRILTIETSRQTGPPARAFLGEPTCSDPDCACKRSVGI